MKRRLSPENRLIGDHVWLCEKVLVMDFAGSELSVAVKWCSKRLCALEIGVLQSEMYRRKLSAMFFRG